MVDRDGLADAEDIEIPQEKAEDGVKSVDRTDNFEQIGADDEAILDSTPCDDIFDHPSGNSKGIDEGFSDDKDLGIIRDDPPPPRRRRHREDGRGRQQLPDLRKPPG